MHNKMVRITFLDLVKKDCKRKDEFMLLTITKLRNKQLHRLRLINKRHFFLLTIDELSQ